MKTFPFPRFGGGFLGLVVVFVTAFFSLFSIHSCSEPDEIGLGLIDRRASFNSTDTMGILAVTDFSDHVPTNFGGENILGVLHDPVFGKSRASIFTQFRLPENNLSLGDEPVLDSITISFGYSGQYYGQIETIQTVRIYELSEEIPDIDTLFSDLVIPHYPEPLAEMLLRPAPNDSVLIDTTMFAPHFSLRLSDAFGQKMIDANGTPAFENVPNFLDYFKGVFVTVDEQIEGTGSVFNIDMYSFFTRLILHYHQEGDTVAMRQNFPINEFTQRSTYFEALGYDNAHPVLVEQIFGEDPYAWGDSLLFVQGMGKFRCNIHFPFIAKLSEAENVTINQARLIIPVAPGFEDEMFPPADELILLRFDEEGGVDALSDMAFGDDYFGGSYDQAREQYSFNITQHLQEIMDGKFPDNGLALVSARSAESAQRVILNGPGSSARPMRLEIIYTVFN
ncbi:MAG: DUF4270 family protein [Bacteroidales bacterium]